MLDDLKDKLNILINQKKFLKDQLTLSNKDIDKFNKINEEVYKIDIKISEYNNLINNNSENNNKINIQYPNG